MVPAALVLRAINSFPIGSAEGPDKLRPQHLRDMVQSMEDSASASPLLAALVKFVTWFYKEIPHQIYLFFFTASLTALKNLGGVHPITVGCTLRCHDTKVACSLISDDMTELLTLHQLRFGVSNGAEAAVHAAYHFLSTMDHDQTLHAW